MGKFWVLIHRGRLLRHARYWPYGVVSPTWTLMCYSKKYAHFTDYKEAEKAASEITKKYGGDVYIMEAVALATVPTTIVKIEG